MKKLEEVGKDRIVLVCGGRDFSNADMLREALDEIHAEQPIALLIHGDCRGADKLADLWATKRGVQVARCPANWGRYGSPAGPIRNRAMLRLKPDLVVAMPGGTGTDHMCDLATEANILIRRYRDRARS